MAAAVLVFDASPLSHFARANELDTLRVLVAGFECVTTKAVRSEMRRGAEHYPALDAAVRLDWVATVPCDDLDELYLFGQYMNRLGNLERNAGEASVLAWAEAHGAAAYVDDQVACNVGRSRGVRVHRTLHLIVGAVRAALMSEQQAQALVNSLVDSDARFPQAARQDLFGWARSQHPPLL
jgi:predicted nucleic acid-binding protein